MIGNILNDRYRIDSEIGQGGMGTVYLAHDSLLDRDVAIKVMSKTSLGTAGRSRLLTEAQMVAQLKHPNIITVFDAGEFEDQPFVVMEYIQGEMLNEHEMDGLVEIVKVAKQICTALQYAHEQKIIHRDLKPENVIIEADGTVRLMDFGLAVSTTSRMTESGLIMGTVSYMSPEQAFGYEVTPQSDLYSLGVILYELTTQQLPFEAEDALAIITQHIHAPVVPPRARNENIPILLNDLILEMLSKDPGDRPGSANEVLSVLENPQLFLVDESSGSELAVLDRIVRGRIIGRQEEFAEARHLWGKATSGQGQTLLISGEPGIGKTRLMHEIITHAEVSGGKAFSGECYAESNAPYAAFSQITRHALTRFSNNGLDLPDAVMDDLLKLTPEMRHQYPNVQPNPALDPETEQQRLFENMVAFCHSFTDKSPLLLVIDDAHWGDSGTLAMLHHLIRRTQNQPVMILVTYREVELSESRPFNDMLLELNRQRQGTRLKLDRLDRQATHDMLQAIFAVEVSAEFADGIYRETDGNPFFIEEVCRALVESGALYYENGEWHRPSMEELEIPQGIQVAVESRLAKLPMEHQEALRMAAVLGREFEFEVLLEALDVDEDSLIEALETAEEAQMIQEADGTGDVTFVFVHALVPSAIVESVRTLRRRKLHRRAAEAIEKLSPGDYEALAYHYGEAGNESLALKYYTLAGERAAAAFANQDAEEHFSAALDLVEGDREEAELLTDLGRSQAHQSKNLEAIKTWGRAIELYENLNEVDKVAGLYARSARAAWDSGDTKGGLEFARKGLSLAEEAPDGPGFAHLLAEASRACYFNGLHEESNQYCQRGLEMAERLDLTAIKIEILTTMGLLSMQTAEESIQLLEKAARLAESHHMLRQATRALNNLAVFEMHLYAEYAKAIQHMQQAADIAKQVGDRDGELFYRSNLGMWMLLQGRLRDAEEIQPNLQSLAESISDGGAGLLAFNQFRSILMASRGNLERAADFILERTEEVRASGDLQRLEVYLSFILQISLITGKLEQGNSAAEEMIQLSEIGMASVAESHSFLSALYSREGEISKARTQYELAAAELERAKLTYFDQILIRLAQAELYVAEQKWEDAWRTYEAVYRLAHENKFIWHANQVRLNWISAYLKHGESEDLSIAIELLEEALSDYQEMGADGFVKMVEEQLANLT